MQLYISRLRDPWGKINTQASPGPTGLQALGGKNGSLPAPKIAVRTMPFTVSRRNLDGSAALICLMFLSFGVH